MNDLARYKIIKVGKAFDIAELRKSDAPRQRRANPRDEDLRLLVNEVSAGPESQVTPWQYGDQKKATARAAANRIIKAMEAKVFVGTHSAFPGVLLFSRQPLSARGRRRRTP